jgi:hypothetical protein
MKLRIHLSTNLSYGLPAILLKYKKPRFFLFALICILLVANIRVLQLTLFMHTSPSTFLMDVARDENGSDTDGYH